MQAETYAKLITQEANLQSETRAIYNSQELQWIFQLQAKTKNTLLQQLLS